MNYIRSIILPIAMLLAVLFHRWCGAVYFLAPYLVFTMLFMAYTAIDVKKMRISKLDIYLILAQTILVVVPYFLLRLCGVADELCDSLLVVCLTPVAASSVVVSCALGASRETVTTFTILDNLYIALLAPFLFAITGRAEAGGYWASFWTILCRIAPQIVFPFFAAMLTQLLLPKLNGWFVKNKGKSLYVWALTLTIVLGKTFHDIVTAPERNWTMLSIQAGLSVVMCGVLFAIGKWLGAKRKEKMAGGQLLGQKNTSFGIWMGNEFLSPMSSVACALYSVWQNIFNSWQMYQHDKRHEPET